MKILIFEPNTNGHRLNYLQIIIRTFIQRGHQVVLLTLDSLKESVFLKDIKNKQGEGFFIRYASMNSLTDKLYAGQKLYNREIINYFMIRRYLKNERSINYDLIFFPYIDNLARLLSLIKNPFGGIKYYGISMVPSFHYKKMGIKSSGTDFSWLKETLFIRLLKNSYARQILTIDRLMLDYIDTHYPEMKKKITYLADPVKFSGTRDRENSRSYFNIPKQAKVILVFGSISERKGIIELLQAAEDKGLPEDVMIIVAGTQAHDVSKKMKGLRLSEKQVLFINKYLDMNEEYMIFKSADLVWCGYKNFDGMSAVLIQAGAMGLPVIACDEGIISWITKKYQIGETINIKDKNQVIHSINSLLNNESLYHTFSENGKKLAKEHSLQQFEDVIAESITL